MVIIPNRSEKYDFVLKSMDSERVLFPIVIKKEIMWELWKELVSKKGWPKKHSLFNTAIYTNRLVNKLI